MLVGICFNRVNNLISDWNNRLTEPNKNGIPCKIAYRAASSEADGKDSPLSDLLQKADERMYKSKRILKSNNE